ncbi:class I SAM-dependent methyltransferase [Desulfoluna spongiiphila]|uniref:Ubiquinone/menaquinone biosynthesis C-methylase UbiE n=1 Tax=Desulfoluna spongiiphila TaxID=419481 RepID=A0A1G5JQ73_9BACT|nr:class I SAM-dependent methyltransferase [Desulfoluna spongiiphila]SCY89878.1 Ubiquinone/menaquinone biosynthesis C-methylase UbiE [Desulfoluna spongiiphila]
MFGIINASAKNFLVQWIVQKEILHFADKYLCGHLIDIGCGGKPYQELLAPYIEKHTGVDHYGTIHDKSHIDLLGTAYEIPVDNSSFDNAICTAVLEHLEEPEQALRECHRVLKPGGHAIYSVPFIWHLHEEPRDFYRYSKYGLKYLFKKAGFELIQIKALSGFWVTFGQLFVYNIYRLNRGPLRYIPVIPCIGIVIQGISYLLDKLDKSEQWTWMYMIIVRKYESERLSNSQTL